MLVEKEVIRPGTYWYLDEATKKPCKLVVTPEMTQYWHDEGAKMLGAGLTVPVPFEHDFNAHPMTPADKLKSNAGWIKEYKRHDGKGGTGDRLFAVVDVQDEELAKKLPRTIRWTSPWINSFTDGKGNQWNNVISHLALTTRPRIVEQDPFPSVAAALSMATEPAGAETGYCLSRAGLLVRGKKSGRLRPRYPVALSLMGGIKLAAADLAPPKKKAPPTKDTAQLRGKPDADPTPGEEIAAPDGDDDPDDDGIDDDTAQDALSDLANPLQDAKGDIAMEELLCDLLQALGVPMPDESNEQEFKRHLYEAAMSKIKELTSKGMGANDPAKQPPDQNKPPTQQPNASQPAKNPLIPQVQQEQQPMYMSLEDINKIEDTTMRTVALSMYTQNQELQARLGAAEQQTKAMQNAELNKATAKRQQRVGLLGRLSPKVKEDLEAMLSLQSNALAMDAQGQIVDPMRATLDMLEKGLANVPQLLKIDHTQLSIMPPPTDADQLSAEGEAKLVDEYSRMMGCAG